MSGDGIDFDWEHLSDDPTLKNQQRKVLGEILFNLRAALDKNGMANRQIGYTTRFNAFWKIPPKRVKPFSSDGEGIDIGQVLTDMGSSFDKTVDWVNIMMYDVPPKNLGAPAEGFTIDNYKQVLSYFGKFIPKNKIVMGFEPGPQAAGGVWEGTNVDKSVVNYIQDKGYGGIMFWAANETAKDKAGIKNGINSQNLAEYASGKFTGNNYSTL